MTNAEIADMLEQYGKLLELSGENPFRTRAYQKAAESIRTHPVGMADVVAAGHLRSLSGVGEGIALAVKEMVETGRYSFLDDLAATMPLTLLDLFSISGLGAKTVVKLHKEFNISTVDELEAAIAAGTLTVSGGLGARTVANISAGLEALRKRSGRHRIGTVQPIAHQILAGLRIQLPEGTQIELAGSVRRVEETVADIDFVIGSEDPDTIRQVLDDSDVLGPLIDDGGQFARYRVTSSLACDFFIVLPGSFAATLVRATGPAAHVERLGDLIDGPSEAAVYEAAGFLWFPPDIRMGGEEFEWATSGKIDKLITVADVKGEFHCHTRWSDGALEVAQMAQAAKDHGYVFLGISDHTKGLTVANGLDEERIVQQRVEIEAAQRQVGIRLFASAEVEVHNDGRLDFADDVLDSLDIVIASTHTGLKQPREELMARLVGVLANHRVDVLAHPSGRLVEQREPGDFDWPAVFAAAAEHGTVLEINADPARLDLKADHARAALAAGVTLTINCDAHHPDGWDNLHYGVSVARKAGAVPDDVVNCWPIERIEAWLRGRP